MDNNLMKLEKLIEKLDRIDGIEFPISDQELCERYENLSSKASASPRISRKWTKKIFRPKCLIKEGMSSFMAEACKVKLALHPDDPPVPSLQGVSRIFRNVENFGNGQRKSSDRNVLSKKVCPHSWLQKNLGKMLSRCKSSGTFLAGSVAYL